MIAGREGGIVVWREDASCGRKVGGNCALDLAKGSWQKVVCVGEGWR